MKTPFPKRRWARAAVLALLAVLGSTRPALAQSDGSADQAAIDRVLQRYHEVSGAAVAAGQIQTRLWASTFAEGKGSVITRQKAPDRLVRATTFTGAATVIVGFDGSTAWQWSTMDGFKELTGDEAAELKSDAQMRNAYDAGAMQRRWLGRHTLDGREVDRIELVRNNATLTASFDVATGLVVREEGPSGTVTYSDYRRIGPEQIPFRQQTAQDTLKVTEVRQNVPTDDGHFVPRRQGIHAWMPDQASTVGSAIRERFREAHFQFMREQPDAFLRLLPPGILDHMGGPKAAAAALEKEYGYAGSLARRVRFHEEGERVWAVMPVQLLGKVEEHGGDQDKSDPRLTLIAIEQDRGNWHLVPAYLLADARVRKLLPAIPAPVEHLLAEAGNVKSGDR